MDVSVVVSNSTPLIALAWLKQLELLPGLFGRVRIPLAAHNEIQHNPEAVGASELSTATWLEVVSVSDRLAVEMLLDQLDRGESEAIVLAHELRAGLLLMDERRGRRRAVQSGLAVAGTIAVLIQARQKGLLKSLRPLLKQLRELPFHMSETLYADVLRRVGE